MVIFEGALLISLTYLVFVILLGNIVYKQSQHKTTHLFYTQDVSCSKVMISRLMKLVIPCIKQLVYCLISRFTIACLS